MIQALFFSLENLNNFLWSHIAFILITAVGFYFSLRSRFFQLTSLPSIFRSFWAFLVETKQTSVGIHPLKAFFAAIGGCVGIGNIVGICTAVQIGGPGALFWTWMGGLFGMLIQYSEVYLGMRYRVKNKQGSYDGGPMYFLPIAYKWAFRGRWIAPIVAFLLCIYGVEIFMFNVMVDSISVNWHIDENLVVAFLLLATIGVALGGINRVGEVCSAILPLFILLYVGMSFWVIANHIHDLPDVLKSVFKGAFTPQAAQGAFAGSSVMLTISMGLSRGAYSGDIGVGYTSVIHAESRTRKWGRQSALAIVAIILDTFVLCTLSLLVVLVTGHWQQEPDASLMVQQALGYHFPFMHFFMPLFLFLLGYTTLLAYFVVGVKCAKFLSPKWGAFVYYAYACISLPLFAFVESEQAFLIMSLSGAFLLILNLSGIFLLRKKISFELEKF